MSSPHLTVVGEKFLPSRCRPGTLCYCPTMDLIAIVTVVDRAGDQATTTEDKMTVWRLNGEPVFGWDAPAGIAIPYLTWKADGRLLAVGTSDGVVRLLSVANGGKIVHSLAPLGGRHDSGERRLSCLVWSVNQSDTASIAGSSETGAGVESLEDLLSLGDVAKRKNGLKADLPRELAEGIDVETSIPKLSTLPPGTGVVGGWTVGSTGGDDDIFSSRASIDAIFHSQSRLAGKSGLHDEVDLLITAYEDRTIYIRIFDCFEIGQIDVSSSLPKGIESFKVIQHAAYSSSTVHTLLIQALNKQKEEEIHVIALDLNFIPQTSPRYLSTLATKSTQLLNLLRYLKQISIHLSIELRGAFELPSRFMRNIDESLAQSSEGQVDFVIAAFQLVVTGQCSGELREWLVDDMGERNLKRWEKASLYGMETIRRLVHECLLPALERCQVVTSRLGGLAGFAKSAQVLGLDSKTLDRVADTVECLSLLSHYLLKTVGKELKQFTAFMKWMRLEVDIQGLERENTGEPGSERQDELYMQRDEMDVKTVLEFIRETLRKSSLTEFVRPSIDARGSSLEGKSYDWTEQRDDTGFYRTFKTMLKARADPGTRPDLDDLLWRLKNQADEVFEGIARTLRRSILHHRICTLPADCDTSVLRARAVANNSREPGHTVFVASKSKSQPDTLTLHRIPISKTKHLQPPTSTSQKSPAGTEIISLDFVDDSDLIVLSTDQEAGHLLALKGYSDGPADDSSDWSGTWESWHEFDLSSGLVPPTELVVNGRKDRRAACVLEGNNKFTVLDLESGPAVEGEGEDEEGEEEGDVDMG